MKHALLLCAAAFMFTHCIARTQTYSAVRPPDSLRNEMKIGCFSIYENPTGIWIPSNTTCRVTLAGDLPAAPLSLRVADFAANGRYKDYPIREKTTTFTTSGEMSGLAYLRYEADDYLAQPKVTLTIEGGDVNGAFRAGDSNAAWKNLLQEAKAPFLDLYGKHVHLVFRVEDLKRYCPEKGRELLERYDAIMGIQQRTIGFGYNRPAYPNRVFGRVVNRGYMFADGVGAGFNANTMRKVLAVDKMSMDDFWGIAHEFGHVHQTRPGFRWLGLIEVTNNMLAMAAAFELTPAWLRLERERVDGMPGGRYTLFTRTALIEGQRFMLQAGSTGTGHNQVGNGDVFVRLIPFWQLYLYTRIAELGNPDFYPAFHDWLRREGNDRASPGQHQLAFIRMACELNRQNLTPYFEAIGMLKPIDVELNDYGKGRLTITEEECQAIKTFAAQFPAPPTPCIQYFNSLNALCFKNRLPLTGPNAPGEGTEKKGAVLTVSHAVWQNPVAFEVYEGEKRVGITLAHVGSAMGEEKTYVRLTPETTAVKAIGWDGAQKTVFVQ